MFHKAVSLNFKEGTTLEVTFQSGEIIAYDIARLFTKYPQMKSLENRKLFKSGRLIGSYGILWNDELDLEVETIFEEGKLISKEVLPLRKRVGIELSEARKRQGISQVTLAQLTGIDQSDISKIERGLGNPSLDTVERIAKALQANINITVI